MKFRYYALAFALTAGSPARAQTPEQTQDEKNAERAKQVLDDAGKATADSAKAAAQDTGDAVKDGTEAVSHEATDAVKQGAGSAERTTKSATSDAKKVATSSYKNAAAEAKHVGAPTRAAGSEAGHASKKAISQAGHEWHLAANEVRKAFGKKPKPEKGLTPINEVPSDATPVEKK